MPTTNVDIANSALYLLGSEGVTALDGTHDVDRADILERVYEPFVEARLTEYPWHFATAKVALSQTTAPLNEWTYAYTIPTTALRVLAVYDSSEVGVRPIRRYDIVGATLLAEDSVIEIDYIADVDEDLWPGVFEEYVVNALAAHIAVAITGKTSLAQHYHQVAYGLPQERGEGGLYARAKAWDSQQSPPNQIQDFVLIDARFGGSGLVVDEKLR